MLKADDNVVIIDFGTLKPAAVDAGTVISKPGFEVPEQLSRGTPTRKATCTGSAPSCSTC
jgi:hypothetical protein